MKNPHHLTCGIALLLFSCDKPQADDGPDTGKAAPPRITRTERPPLTDRPDPRDELFEEFRAAERIKSAADREAALAEVAWNSLDLDPDLARQAFHQLPADSPDKIDLIEHFALRMAEEDLDAAMAWAASLDTGKESATAYGQIALAISDTDPERAANLLSESGIAGEEFDVAVVQVLQRWAVDAPADAAAWVRLFPSSEAREAGIRIIISEWTESDVPAAISWIQGLGDIQIREEAALGMAEALLQQPVETRKEWMDLTPPGIRAEIESQYEQAVLEVGDDPEGPAE